MRWRCENVANWKKKPKTGPGRRHSDRNAGGGDHHRAVYRAGGAVVMETSRHRPDYRNQKPDPKLHDGARLLQTGHRIVSPNRTGLAGPAREAPGSKPVGRPIYAEGHSERPMGARL